MEEREWPCLSMHTCGILVQEEWAPVAHVMGTRQAMNGGDAPFINAGFCHSRAGVAWLCWESPACWSCSSLCQQIPLNSLLVFVRPPLMELSKNLA